MGDGYVYNGGSLAALCGDGVSSCIWIVVLATQTHDTVVNIHTHKCIYNWCTQSNLRGLSSQFLGFGTLITQDIATEEPFYIKYVLVNATTRVSEAEDK